MTNDNSFYGLLHDELCYELFIRGEKGESLTKRRAEMLLYNIEDAVIPPIVLNQRGELKLCQTKIRDLGELINVYAGTDLEEDYIVLNNRLAHFIRRILRLTEAQLKDEVDLLMKLLITLDQTLDDRCRANKRRLTTTTTPVVSVSVPIRSAPTPKILPVFKWNCTFNGSGSVIEFLKELEELRVSRQASKEDLFNSARDLFKESALIWYRANRDTFADWNQLLESLKRQYLPPDHDHELEREILCRRQKPHESLTDFINVMQLMYGHLVNPVPESKKVTTMRFNMLPEYRRLIAVSQAPTVSVQQLLELCQNLELSDPDSRKSIGSRHPSPSRPPTFQRFRSPSPARTPYNPSTPPPSPSQPSTSRHTQPLTFRGTSPNSRHVSFAVSHGCWNCKASGHTFNFCPAPRTRFCFRCGKPDFTVFTCPTCNPASGKE